MSNCSLTDVGVDWSGALALINAVRCNATLEYLGLNCNHLLPPAGTVHAAYVTPQQLWTC